MHNNSTWDIEAGRWGVQDFPWLRAKFETWYKKLKKGTTLSEEMLILFSLDYWKVEHEGWEEVEQNCLRTGN